MLYSGIIKLFSINPYYIYVMKFVSTLVLFLCFLASCGNDDGPIIEEPKSVLPEYFGDNIDYANLPNYANQEVPDYITKDNTRGNDITDEGATLGRVMFYDKKLSVDNSLACANCHRQELAFGDDELISKGVNGFTGRHSMRLVNARFGEELSFFWDKRAANLEEQTTQPIQDHIEMGYSGEDGDPSIADLVLKMEAIEYYPELFFKAFGDSSITEIKIQNALAQFVRSIQSFDSKYDEGLATAGNHNAIFTHYSDEDHAGNLLFSSPGQFDAHGVRTAGGLGCRSCHRPPEFDIDPRSLNNGVIGSAASATLDLSVTRAPSLRDLVNLEGEANGHFMHAAIGLGLNDVLDHYNQIDASDNTNLDLRLRPQNIAQNLAITEEERLAVIAFLKTLTGTNIYSDPKWSNPFME